MSKINDYYKLNGYSIKKLVGNDIVNGPLNNLWRLRIIYNRETSTMLHREVVTTMPNPKNKNTEVTEEQRDYRNNTYRADSETEDRGIEEEYSPIYKNKIILFDTSTSPATKVTIQGMPKEVNCSSDSTFAAVKSMGRNNPFYMFTGSEDTISFDISWYSVQPNDRSDVINKCRLLESWTKADGYSSSPPTINISWGSSNLFKDQSFILVSAPYKLENFQSSYRPVISSGKSTVRGTDIIDLKLLPNTAFQKLTFKRITGDNLTHEQIISREELSKTTGVELGNSKTNAAAGQSSKKVSKKSTKHKLKQNKVRKYRKHGNK